MLLVPTEVFVFPQQFLRRLYLSSVKKNEDSVAVSKPEEISAAPLHSSLASSVGSCWQLPGLALYLRPKLLFRGFWFQCAWDHISQLAFWNSETLELFPNSHQVILYGLGCIKLCRQCKPRQHIHVAVDFFSRALVIDRWNMSKALHSPKSMRRHSNMPRSHANAVFLHSRLLAESAKRPTPNRC